MTKKIDQTVAFEAKYHAHRLSEKLLLVGYMRSDDDASFQTTQVHQSFEKLAALLGFKIELIDAQEPVAVWQPIATAPRDGSLVWLWNKHCLDKANAPQQFWWSTNYSVFGLGGCWTDGLCTMGDVIDFDFWCDALPANFMDPYATDVVAVPAVSAQVEVA